MERQTASESLAQKALAYGIPGIKVDGNDIFAVIRVTREAITRAARGEGPTLIEAMTYRISGHATADDPKMYRSDALVEPWRRRDPLARLRRHVELAAGWTDAQNAALEAEIDAEIKQAVLTAERTAPPPVTSLFDDVFQQRPWHLVEQRNDLLQRKTRIRYAR